MILLLLTEIFLAIVRLLSNILTVSILTSTFRYFNGLSEARAGQPTFQLWAASPNSRSHYFACTLQL